MAYVKYDKAVVDKRTGSIIAPEDVCEHCDGLGHIIIPAEQVYDRIHGTHIRDEYEVKCICQKNLESEDTHSYDD